MNEEILYSSLTSIYDLIIYAVSFALYVVQVLALKKAAEVRGIKNGWLAWIPGGNMYILFKVAGINGKLFILPILGMLGLIFSLILLIVSLTVSTVTGTPHEGNLMLLSISSLILGVSIILLIISAVFTYIAYFKIAKIFNINIVFPILCIFINGFYNVYFIILYKAAKGTQHIESTE